MKTNHFNTLLFSLAVALPITACENRGAQEPAEVRQGAVAQQPAAAVEDRGQDAEEKIEAVKEGEVAMGTQMNIEGEVDEKISNRAFKLEAANELWGEEVLVLTKNEMQVPDGAKVKVDGTVRKLVVAEVERELGWDLEPQIEAEFRDKNVLVAQDVSVQEPAAAGAQ